MDPVDFSIHRVYEQLLSPRLQGEAQEADVQFLVAINRPLAELLETGVLRQGIFYRFPPRFELTTLRSVLTDLGSEARAKTLLRQWNLPRNRPTD